ncbi:hypothetical protein SAMN05421847_0555 [Halpernia humi]|uniref:Uncharacterized protein n=1 Tax=Halpernia humi TaxID=493375 RepID=A0A1H5TS27_9FLAO|nr:hypothetical protein [Halpernia humi]SEF65550.1 hypothetical protein SAMN05421847_0555 [Halpernia humi]
MKLKIIFFFAIFILLNSCSPLYTLFVQNNSAESVEIYVELKNEKFAQKYRTIFEKREMYFFKKVDNAEKFNIDSTRFYFPLNKISNKKYTFTSNLDYNFKLEPNSLTDIDPNNSIEIFPFDKVYYLKNGKKCFIIPKSENCNYKIISKETFTKNKNVKRIADFIEIEN